MAALLYLYQEMRTPQGNRPISLRLNFLYKSAGAKIDDTALAELQVFGRTLLNTHPDPGVTTGLLTWRRLIRKSQRYSPHNKPLCARTKTSFARLEDYIEVAKRTQQGKKITVYPRPVFKAKRRKLRNYSVANPVVTARPAHENVASAVVTASPANESAAALSHDRRKCEWCPRVAKGSTNFLNACCHKCRTSKGKVHGPLCTKKLAPNRRRRWRGIRLGVPEGLVVVKVPQAKLPTVPQAELPKLKPTGHFLRTGRRLVHPAKLAHLLLSGDDYEMSLLLGVRGVAVYGMPRSATNVMQAYLSKFFSVDVQPSWKRGSMSFGIWTSWKHAAPVIDFELPRDWVALCLIKHPLSLLKSLARAPEVSTKVIQAANIKTKEAGNLVAWLDELSVNGLCFEDYADLWNCYARGYLARTLAPNHQVVVVKAEDLAFKPIEVLKELARLGLETKAGTHLEAFEQPMSFGCSDRQAAIINNNCSADDVLLDCLGREEREEGRRVLAKLSVRIDHVLLSRFGYEGIQGRCNAFLGGASLYELDNDGLTALIAEASGILADRSTSELSSASGPERDAESSWLPRGAGSLVTQALRANIDPMGASAMERGSAELERKRPAVKAGSKDAAPATPPKKFLRLQGGGGERRVHHLDV